MTEQEEKLINAAQEIVFAARLNGNDLAQVGRKVGTGKSILLKLIDEIPESQIREVIDFILFLKNKQDNQVFKDLLSASESSIDFWDNDIDDEVWNNV